MCLQTNGPVCNTPVAAAVVVLTDVPAIGTQLWPDEEAARNAPKGDVELCVCETCGFIWNRAFDPRRMQYAPGYENALHFSPKFQVFAEDLAEGLVERFGLHGKPIVEIGCGDGHMLDLMVQKGVASATGFDPSMKDVASPFAERDGVSICPEYFGVQHLDQPFEAILCRHVLEHLDTPLKLAQDIRQVIGERDVPIYFEVPNADWMLRAVSMWDVIYEHVGYWTAPAVTTLFERAGFEIVSVQEGYGDQFLMVEARPAAPDPTAVGPGVDAVVQSARSFGEAANAELKLWRSRLSADAGRTVIWGAGSKGITFANALGSGADTLAAMVDLNTRKHELIVPGSAVPVVAPEKLMEIEPDLVLISNTQYQAEIEQQVRDLGLQPDFAVIAG